MLTLVEKLGKEGKAIYLCSYCGKHTTKIMANVENWGTRSCGCAKHKLLSKANTTHGMSRDRLYRVYRNMLSRCYKENHTYYYNYGGRGIGVCPEWRDSLENFVKWAQDTGYSDKLTLDRICNNADYSPGNCRWTEKGNQSRNQTKSVSNKSGVQGVYFDTHHQAYIAHCQINGKTKTRTFTVGKHGEVRARELAIEAREQMINTLRDSGLDYSLNHGVEKVDKS